MREIVPASNGYQKGLEAGQQVAGSWKPSRLTLPEKWREATIEAANICGSGRRDLNQMLTSLAQWSREDMLAYAADLQRRKLDAFPDLKTFPELAGMDQYEDEYPKGYAAGAGIDVREVHLENHMLEIYFLALGVSRLSGHNCSECYIPNTPDGPMLGLGRDDIMGWYTDDPFGVSWPPLVEQPNQITGPPEANPDFGICLANGGGALYEFEEMQDKVVFQAPVLSLVQDYCTSTEEAVEMLIRYNDYWGPCQCVVGDAQGNGALFEKSKYDYAVRTTKGEPLISTYGGCDDEKMRRMCDTENPLFKYYERRIGMMRQILAQGEANGGIDGEVFWNAMLNHDEQGAGCQHRETMPTGVELFTHVAYYVLPAQNRVFRRAIARDNGHVLYPCQVPIVEVRT
jgi:hypothetical protein